MRPLTVLIANQSLGLRGGVQTYTLELARGLLARGHRPVVYSPEPGPVADELTRHAVAVTDDLASLGTLPDVIHGNSGCETLTALLRFPSTPAVFVCHGWLSWQAAPPPLARVLRIVAVDTTARDRLVLRHGIADARVEVMLNAADLTRFALRSPLPARPQRALVFSNYASELTFVDVVRAACDRAGIALDVVGHLAGTASPEPERILARSDVVFAKGKAAIEALATGCAVIVCDFVGVGPMVTTGELEALRRLNFGIATMRFEATVDEIERQLRRYDPADAAEVARRVRATAGADHLVERLVDLYRQVLAEAAGRTWDLAADASSAADYLRWMSIQQRGETDSARLIPIVRLAHRTLRVPVLGRGVTWVAKTLARATRAAPRPGR